MDLREITLLAFSLNGDISNEANSLEVKGEVNDAALLRFAGHAYSHFVLGMGQRPLLTNETHLRLWSLMEDITSNKPTPKTEEIKEEVEVEVEVKEAPKKVRKPRKAKK